MCFQPCLMGIQQLRSWHDVDTGENFTTWIAEGEHQDETFPVGKRVWNFYVFIAVMILSIPNYGYSHRSVCFLSSSWNKVVSFIHPDLSLCHLSALCYVFLFLPFLIVIVLQQKSDTKFYRYIQYVSYQMRTLFSLKFWKDTLYPPIHAMVTSDKSVAPGPISSTIHSWVLEIIIHTVLMNICRSGNGFVLETPTTPSWNLSSEGIFLRFFFQSSWSFVR